MPIRLYSDGPIRESDSIAYLYADGGPSRLRFPTPTSELYGWDGYQLDMLGEFVAEPDEDAPIWEIEGDTVSFCLEVRRAIAWCPPAPMVGVVQWDPGSQTRQSIEVTSSQWGDSDLRAAGRALRLLTARLKRRGPQPGSGAKFKTPDEWQAAIREKVLTKTTRLTADDETIAHWLAIGTTSLYEYLKRPGWEPSTLEDLRNGKF